MEDRAASLWSESEAGKYERENYHSGMAAYVLRRSHELIERPFSRSTHFRDVLEVGAGSGIHFQYIRHTFDRYVMTDSSEAMLGQMRKYPGVTYERADAANLPYPNEAFDRVIAAHVLEHLYRPHEVLMEWSRVLRRGGVLSIVLPSDPGILWRLGRFFGPRAAGHRRGLEYDYVMALEHVNSIGNLVTIIRHFYKNRREAWWPLRVSNTDLNLIYAVNATK